MKKSVIPTALLAVLLSTDAMAAAAVREVHVTPLSASDTHTQVPADHRIATDAVETNALQTAPSPMDVVPVAGITNRDYAIPFFVDLDDGPGIRDFNCGRLTFDGHTGHDPYIRSFREQQIGVPVFAVRDGVVLDVRDGEPDENTNPHDTTARANYVYLRHGTDERTQYVHLKRNSITVAVGDFVPAGTQIGMVGSSGPSGAPHIHFETTVNGQAAEPLAGPCRAGLSALPHQEQQVITDRPIAFGATFSKESFANFRNAPFDDAPHTGTFLLGRRTMYFKAELANVGTGTSYSIKLDRPGSRVDVLAATGTLVNYDASLISIWWTIEADLDRVGTWSLILNADGKELLNAPFTVVTTNSQDVNRPPSPFTVAFEASALVPNHVPVCRVDGPMFADPDYDVLTYHYRWSVGNEVVRDVISAARTDALPRDRVRAGTTLTCSVTASDGKVETQPVSTFARVDAPRRRAARK